MLMIRLSRTGKKKYPTFRVVVQEKQKATSSNVVEILGHYNPQTNPATLEVKAERVHHWIGVGAQLSNTLHNLLITKGVIQGDKRKFVKAKKIAKDEEEKSEPASAQKPAETPAVSEKPSVESQKKPQVEQPTA